MKPLPICLLIALCISCICCKKETIYVLKEDFTFRIREVVNDSSIVLSWNGYSSPSFKEYRLVRSYKYIQGGKLIDTSETLTIITDTAEQSFPETKVPFSHQVLYQLKVYNDTGMVLSRQVVHERKQGIFRDRPDDALIDTVRNLLYIIDRTGSIGIYNYIENRQVKKVTFPTSIGYCAFGSHGGKKELYVPRGDGWVDFLDADSLSLIDRLYVSGLEVGSVIFNDSKLFISTNNESDFGPYERMIMVFDRASKMRISQGGVGRPSRLLLLPGTNTELIEMTMQPGNPGRLYRNSFDGNGKLLGIREENRYTRDYPKQDTIFKVFPAGDLLIASHKGSIFDTTLTFKRYISGLSSPDKNYSDFAFNDTGNIVYSSLKDQPIVEVIVYPSLNIQKTFTTALLPKKVFRDGNLLIVVSCGWASNDADGSSLPYLIFEKFSL